MFLAYYKWFESVNNDIKIQIQTFELAKSLCSKQKNAPTGILLTMVGAAGFEPTLAESESDVLPLNYAPIRGHII